MAWVAALAAVVGSGAAARAAFLDLTLMNTSNGGRFVGSLDGVAVTGSAATSVGTYGFSPTGPLPNFDSSTSKLDGSSPQFSYASVYDPVVALADQLGFATGDKSTSTITINFATPVTNPQFHVANLNLGTYTFALTGGLTGISFVRGNGGGGDGFQVSGNAISDANPATLSKDYATNLAPPTTGGRGAFGTVSLIGTISALTINVTSNFGTGGSFTLSTVPEPTATAVVGLSGLALILRRRVSGSFRTARTSLTAVGNGTRRRR